MAEVIDEAIDAKLKEENVTPAPQANDATIARRLTLDLVGRAPTVKEAKDYIQSQDPAKRDAFIERLMNSPLYARHAATEFNTLLQGPDGTGPDLREYLIAAMKENRPWNQIFLELMGETEAEHDPQQFVRGRVKNVDVLTRDASAIFFGINVTCCQCHTHPYVESLTQDYYHGMKGFFTRSYEFHGKLFEKQFGPKIEYETGPGKTKEVGLMFLTGTKVDLPKPETDDLGKAIQEENKKIEELNKKNLEAKKTRAEALALAKKKEEEKKEILESGATPDRVKILAAIDKEISDANAKAKEITFVYPEDASYSFRGQLSDVALRPKNEELFARSIVNRVWHRLFGHGLVMRVDQMHDANPGSHPQLLAWLARDMRTHNYDLRRLVKGIVSSKTYSRGSKWNPDDPTPPDKELFAVANLRALTPMQYGVSILLCGDPAFPPAAETFDNMIAGVEKTTVDKFKPIVQQPTDDFEVSADEALGISNDAERLKLVGAKLVPELLKIEDGKQRIEHAVWAVLSRAPRTDEVALLGEYVTGHAGGADGANTAEALRQMVWALTTSAEFRFNH